MKILIADDDAVSRRMIGRILEKAGYDVVTAADGRQALEEILRDGGPRLALLDWMMPELDGLEVCRAIRARQGSPYVYITMLSARLTDTDIVAGLEAGLDDYLTKPCNPEELKARLRAGQRILRLEDSLVAAREEMRFKATHDALTGLWNQGAIVALLESELARSAREGLPVSILMCDLDHFKTVNDNHGHLVGDDLLRKVAVRLQDAVRSFDAVGRYGGEEFLIVLKGCGSAHLADRAEQVRAAIACSSFSLAGVSLDLSVSLGALAADDWTVPQPVEQLLRRTDAALYSAKAAGRNRISLA